MAKHLSPEQVERVGELWLKGWTISQIARELNYPHKTISVWVRKLREKWDQEISILPAEIVAQLRQLRAEAWKVGLKHPGAQRLIAWTIEQEARIAGVYQQPKDTNTTEIRVAGHTPEQVREMLLEKVRRLLGPSDN